MKLNITYFILIILMLSSCLKKEKKDFYYPNQNEFEKVPNKDTLKLTTFFNFEDFRSKMWNFHRTNPDKNPVLLIEKK